MAERILIWGAGAIGGSVAAWLKRAGHDITFVDVVPEHVAAIRDPGLRITGPVEEFVVYALRQSVAAMVAFNRTSAKTHSGVWRDLALRKRHTEVDVQIAPIAEIGARYGIDCRATSRLVEMIHEVEEGRRTMTDDNLLEGWGEGRALLATLRVVPPTPTPSRKGRGKSFCAGHLHDQR
jgi:ketopantoate reductase